jgi:hypothetical protein
MHRFLALLILAGLLAASSLSAGEGLNTLSAAEKQAGWRLLFDGQSLAGWRTYREGGQPGPGWKIEDGILKKLRGVPAGDLMTGQTFTDFEFSWEWRLEEKGNNGVKYFIIPERKAAVGHEYQMIDDTTVKKDALSSCASFYLVVAPNGARVLAYECGDPAILEQVQKTKFKDALNFGRKVTGHLLLTDHKDECWFRNLKLRELK